MLCPYNLSFLLLSYHLIPSGVLPSLGDQHFKTLSVSPTPYIAARMDEVSRLCKLTNRTFDLPSR